MFTRSATLTQNLYLFFMILVIAILTFGGCASDGNEDDSATVSLITDATADNSFSSGGETRTYRLYVPDGITDDAPLVFVLHGYGGIAASMTWTQMSTAADQYGFAVVYPQALEEDGTPRWQSGRSTDTSIDVDYLTALAQFLQSELSLSTEHTFVTGISNGGDMSYRLACEGSDVFKAAAPVAGCMFELLRDSCSPADPPPILEIHGTADGITLWDGDPDYADGLEPYLGTLDVIDFWQQQNDCTPTSTETLPDTDTTDGSTVEVIKCTGGTNGNEVWLYKVIGGEHWWPGVSGSMDFDSTETIWSFFSLQISD